MSNAQVVTMSQRALVFYAPVANGQLRYHLSDWDRYGVKTRCGSAIADYDGKPVAEWTRLRRDTADLIADPCRVCFRLDAL